jgi:hypothetical protein
MLFGEAGITCKELAEMLVGKVFKELGSDTRPPCNGGDKTDWTCAVRRALKKIAETLHYDTLSEHWRLDVTWWADCEGRSRDALILVAQSEWGDAGDVENDFVKLRSFKCPVKLLVFSGDVDEVKRRAENDLRPHEQHVNGEEYLFVGFTASGPRCFCFKVPHDGKLKGSEEFKWQDIRVRCN